MIHVSLGWKTKILLRRTKIEKKGCMIKCEWLWQYVQKSEFLIKFIQVTHGNSCEWIHKVALGASKLWKL